MRFTRASGLLLHPTSLPGRSGIGELGPAAYEFVDFLAAAGQTIWQVLPVGPTGYGNSPYASYSAFAGSPLFLSLDRFADEGMLSPADLEPETEFPLDRVDYDAVTRFKEERLKRAFVAFSRDAAQRDRMAFERWCHIPQTAQWLDDYAFFMALKGAHENKPMNEWDPALAMRDPRALSRAREQLEEEIWYHKFLQWQFDRQWDALRAYANQRGVAVMGDIPLYVCEDSADVWSNPEIFHLDHNGRPTVVAGVPPDYFSETGQLWGNPLYRWDVIDRSGYSWWIERIRVLFSRVDRLRIDHFRGFESYWEIPAGEETAIRGHWVPGPGQRLFVALERALGVLPIIAEDLGIITPEVEALRDQFDLPGMRILHFAFGSGSKNAYLPHNYTRNSVTYTGTHDNNTSRGWFSESTAAIQKEVLDYVDSSEEDVVWGLLRAAMASVADTCIIPAQDLLDLPAEHRMNTPSVLEGNWEWRLEPDALDEKLAGRLRRMAELYGRVSAR